MAQGLEASLHCRLAGRYAARALLIASAATGLACADDRGREGPLIVSNAGSLARPLRAALDTFAAREGVRIAQEHAGSLEAARRLTELRQTPDVIALADWEVFPALLMPEHVGWYARFARNRMVLAYNRRSRYADSIDAVNWWRFLQDDVQTGRAEPDLDPAGYRTLLVWQLAEQEYGEPGLAARLSARAPARHVRAKSAELVGLLEAGELDFAWVYESVARSARLEYVRLPPEIDLGSAEHAARYARASLRIRGASLGDSLEVRGSPILYAISIPRAAPHPRLAERFVAFLLSDEGSAILRAEQLDVLQRPELVGEDVPNGLAELVGSRESTAGPVSVPSGESPPVR